MFAYSTRISYAGVCGGMLRVWILPWVIRTCWPVRRSESLIGLPERSTILVSGETVYTVMRLRLNGLPA